MILLVYIAFLTSYNAVSQGTIPCPPAICIPISATVIKSYGQPAPAPVNLKTPVFLPGEGSYPYASSIQIMADSLPTGATVEYSTNSGSSWTTGNSFTIAGDNTILARTRSGSQVSTITRALFTVSFQRMAVFGNSISNNGPDASIGWLNNNGMAASVPDSDYVHRLQQKLLLRNSQLQTLQLYGVPYEQSFWSYDFNGSLNPLLQTFNPDLIIVRISENLDDNQVSSRSNGDVFRTSYGQLLTKLTQFSPAAKVICTTSFWDNPISSQIIRDIATQRGFLVADITRDIRSRSDYNTLLATQYSNPAVAKHPNDKGMAAIASLIWLQILK